jgi:predicted peroxiredoxin
MCEKDISVVNKDSKEESQPITEKDLLGVIKEFKAIGVPVTLCLEQSVELHNTK